MTGRDVAKSARQWKQALADKLQIPTEQLDRMRTEAHVDMQRWLAERGIGQRPIATDGSCASCGEQPKHGTIMLGDLCSRCWRQS